MGDVKAVEIAKFLNSELLGNNIVLNNVTSLNNVKKSSLIFSKNNNININIECLILVSTTYLEDKNNNYSIIKVNNPRLAFAKVVNEFFITKKKKKIDVTAIIGVNCNIDSAVSIGANSVIGENVAIGINTIINNNIVIYDNTVIGDNCYIKSGSIIGEDGFGFDFEEDGSPVRIPHIGKVIIGNNVEVGAKNTIARGTLNDTIIDNNVKIDDQVHIGHNCTIGENTIIAACSEISGSVNIGKNCWIAPNSSIIQKVKIGDNVTIGIGSIVTKNIESNKKIMGLESLELKPLIKVKKRIEYGK
jgi:UDP-3-O-[3-hydroxymyristoyl] glucosamine N-acyltransferase LpxD